MSDDECNPAEQAGGAAHADAPGRAVAQHLLDFQQSIVEELLENDGMTIMGQGMGVCTIAAALLAVHHLARASGGVVLILGATQAQRGQIAAELQRLCPDARAIADVTAEMTASQRSALLHATKHLFITTRILVVDLLTQRLPTHQVAGLLILNAHRATEQSGEGFAVRLLRAGNRAAFVRGLSDEPGLASRGLSALERTLRALHVREVFLWPRFRSEVQDNMIAVNVHEMECELSGPMAAIQLALVKVLDGMLRTVQRGNKLDSSELALSHAFSRNFDATIKQQLNSIWNTVSQGTRALIKDLRTVQDLLRYLLRFNCVSFLRYLQCLRAAAGPATEWLMLAAANTVFQEAKARVYKVDNAPGRGAKPQLQPVLEEQPKWVLLQHIAEEIQTQRGMLASRAHAAGDGGASTSAPVLSGQRHDRHAVAIDEATPAGPPAHVDNGDTASRQRNGDAVSGQQAARQAAEEPCTPRAGQSPVKESLLEASPGLRVIGAGGDEDGEGTHEDSTAWIQCLSAEEAQACADAPVLVVAKEPHLLTELRSVLAVHGGKAYLQKLYDMYLLERLSNAQRETGLARDNSGEASTSGGGGGRGRGRGRGRGAAGRAGRGGRSGPTRKEQGMYKLQMLNATPDEERAMEAAASSVLEAFNENAAAAGSPRSKKRAAPAPATAGTPRKRQKGSTDVSRARDAAGASLAKGAEGPLLQGFHFVASEDAQEGVLHALRPLFVVLYDVDLVWIRMLECYQSLHPERPVQAYMMSYHDSVEVAKFQQSASREKQAFLSLIQKKGHMVLPTDEAGNVASLAKPQSELARNQQLLAGGARLQAGNAVTRRAGGHAALRAAAPTRVVVDIREFMSQLPAVLHSRGLEVAPVTLEVADFVLTAAICIERKAIPDLISSLDSGRLFTQAQAMSKHYATPVLLIEFDPDKAFALQSTADIGQDIRASNLASKLVLLLLNFPKLSLHATADMFSLLKAGQDEPDAKVAAEVGLEDAEAMGSDVANPTARDMLLRMPGVTPSNVHSIMELGGSLAGLAEVGVKELQRVMGASGGKALHAFLAAPCQV